MHYICKMTTTVPLVNNSHAADKEQGNDSSIVAKHSISVHTLWKSHTTSGCE